MATTPELVKTDMIKIRVDPKQLRDLEYAAARSHLDLSTWMRQHCLDEATRLLKNVRDARRRRRR